MTVGRLDVAVQHALGVQVGHCLRELHRPDDGAARLDDPAAALYREQMVGQVALVTVLHDHAHNQLLAILTQKHVDVPGRDI